MIPSVAVLLLAFMPLGTDEAPSRDLVGATRTYQIRQTVTLDQIPEDAGTVRWWISIPGDDRFQEILDFEVVETPGTWSIERESEHGNRFLFVEVERPQSTSLQAVIRVTLRRRPIWVDLAGPTASTLTDSLQGLFKENLRQDAPHMSVTADVSKIATEVCGDETDVATQARKLLDYVADTADHYSKDPTKPKCGIGDAEDCMTNLGGCCTDLHSLFIALARAREIPSRLQVGYLVLEKNEGKEVDPGYRCWVEYFVPGRGWIAADIVEGDALDGLGRDRWFTGLTERRVWLNEGRDFLLSPRQEGPRVNTMVIGYAEIDGKPARVLPEGDLAPQLSRTVLFQEIESAETAPRGGASSG